MIIMMIALLIAFFVLNYYKTRKSLHMLQQNLYNENNRYVKWIIKNNKQFINLELLIIVISLIGTFVIYDLETASQISIIMATLLLIVIGLGNRNNLKNEKTKKKLVITHRIKRLIVTILILFLIPIIMIGINISDWNILWKWILVLTLMTYFNNFTVLLAMFINTPIERFVYLYYKNKAQKKLKEMKNLKIIGITGSYGKTSTKNIMSDILNCKYNALPTPKNLNTYYGLIMTVNNNLDKFTDIFIAEMGAYVRGDIAGLCKLVKPQYGVLTTIGTAHLESFGSEENIIKAKFELIESLPSDGFAILNKDDPKQVAYPLKNKIKKIWIGILNKEADIIAENIKCSNIGTSFDVKIKEVNKTFHFETKLLGNHNVYNILDGIACGREFGISMEDLIQAVKTVQPVEHRLELKKIGNFYMIDDAYNSNPVGSKMALEVLSMMPGQKVVVTPGMIELGAKEDEYNKKFGEQISEISNADYVILIGEKKTRPIKEGLLTKGFDKERIIVFNDVREAYPFINELAHQEETYALFENDLPDTYNEK